MAAAGIGAEVAVTGVSGREGRFKGRKLACGAHRRAQQIGAAYFSTRILIFRSQTASPWFWRAIAPVLAVANCGHCLNLEAATRALKSGEPISYSTTFMPFIQCCTWPWSTTMRAWLNWPTVLVM